MYLPRHFDEPDVPALHELIREHPLATLVTPLADGFDANHVPLLLDTEPAPLGTLRGHIARANPLRELAAGTGLLAIFHGPEAYVSPSWYPGKAEHGRVVPTWNYAVVHAHGRLRLIDDPAWLRAHLEEATARHEAGFAQPWQLADAPADYIEAMLGAVVGIEIQLTRLTGKFKLSQNQPERNREGVVAGLRTRGTPAALEMADFMARRKQ